MTEDSTGRLWVAIDGPAASGKSTVALGLSRRLGLVLVDSGSMYRAVTFFALETGVDVGDESALGAIAADVSPRFRLELRDGEALRVFVGDREVTDDIRMPAVGAAVSPVSEAGSVRSEMVKLQRCLVEGRDAVVEGRDIGTTVLPEAQLKVFLEASREERARRRYLEMRQKGVDVTPEGVLAEITERDRIDSGREVSPLAAATDAVLLDTTGKSVADVVDEVVGLLQDRGLVH